MDMIVHSLVFFEMLGDDLSVEGFLTSDRRKSCLWEIKTNAFVKLMHDVGKDYPATAQWARNPNTGEFVAWQGNGAPPASLEDRAHRHPKGDLNRALVA
jgi:hypothetical protein